MIVGSNGGDVESLRAFLVSRDVPCPSCRYNLRGLTADRCPECSQSLVLGVLLSEPRLGAFVTGLVGLAAGAGFSGLLLVYGLVMFVFDSPGMFFLAFLLTTGGGLVVEGGLLLAWVLLGRRFRRWSAAWRWSLVAAAWALTIVNLVVFTVSIR